MPVNWNLFTPVDISGKFDEGWDRGTAMREKQELKSALAAFSQNPSDPRAQSALARVSPQFAAQMAQQQWKEQAAIRERERIGALLGDDASSIPAGLNGKPAKIDYRARQQAALRAGDTAAATALGSMADDQERIAANKDKMSKVTSNFNPVTGAETYYDWQGNPVGDDQHPFVRDSEGLVHPHGWKPPVEAPVEQPLEAAPAAAPDELAPQPATPMGSPLDGSIVETPSFDLFGPVPANAQPGEDMEHYLTRKAKEQAAREPGRAAEIERQLVEMVRAYRSGRR